jgi:hypothetical protein
VAGAIRFYFPAFMVSPYHESSAAAFAANRVTGGLAG